MVRIILLNSPELVIEETDYQARGSESVEKQNIDSICSRVLGVTFFKDIPEPKEGEKKLFAFCDSDISKIENIKKCYDSDKPNASEILDFIDNLSETKITPQLILTITQKIDEHKDITQEERTKILNYLTSHLNKNGKLNQ